MAIQIRDAKIVPPQLPRELLSRPRLQAFVRKNKDKRLILIQGQAAQGKSTLAASCIKTVLPRTAWVNLDSDDSKADSLFSGLVHSLKYSLAWPDVSNLLSYPAIDTAPRIPRCRYREWADALFEGVSGVLYIVFDGLDRFKDENTSLDLIRE